MDNHTDKNTKDDLTGTLLAGRYLLKKHLGRGSRGSVYLAEDKKLDKNWAVKIVPGLTGDELTALKRVNHPAFPRIVDVTEYDGKTALIMDHIAGESLSEYIKGHTANVDMLTEWALEIAEALRYLHSITPAILYLDCKPSNMILGEDGHLYLVDLGSSYVTGISGSHRISGTLPYAAPEQRHGICVDNRSDIYAFGMTLKILGQLPDPDLSFGAYFRYRFAHDKRLRALSVIVSRCISEDPGSRYQSADELIYHLTHPASIGYRLPSVGVIMKRFTDILYKNVVTIFSILSFHKYSYSKDPAYLLLGGVLFFLLICLSNRRVTGQNVSVLRCYKDIYLHDLAGAALLILLCSLLTKDYGYAASKPPASYSSSGVYTPETVSGSRDNKYDITIYDREGAKVLYKGQYVVSDGNSLYLCIPGESLSTDHIPARVEVR